ncbi:MAG: DUF503 domain-containing protein [Planctomycetes bacterium]|nr:DUF503 domain-containing protein [Planctomycetota bacterium]
MLIAAIQLELSIPWAMSLKDKRSAVKSLKEKIQSRFRASAAEVGDQDVWRSAVIGIAVVGNDVKFLQSVSQKIVNFAEEYPNTRLEDFTVEII